MMTASARAAISIGIAVLLLSSPALGQRTPPPRWALELQAGPYRPGISSERTDRQFFWRLFHAKDRYTFRKRPLVKSVAVNWYLHSPLGLLGLVGSVGHWRASGNALRCTEEEDDEQIIVECTTDTWPTAQTGDTPVTFTLVPFNLSAVYRFDVLKRNYDIPFVLHAKAGVDYTLWWATAGGDVSKRREDGDSAQGGILGLSGSVGAGLNLDWLEPGAARRGFASSGITDTYLVFDITQKASFESDRPDMTGRVYNLGLSIEFR